MSRERIEKVQKLINAYLSAFEENNIKKNGDVFMKKKKKIWFVSFCLIFISIFTFCVIKANEAGVLMASSIQTNATGTLSNKKISWGIKREKDHKQPDVGAANKKIIDQYEGICMGNANSKKVYLTFDEGYEAGYTPSILETLKNNNVKATFFITAHFLNTQEGLVKQMIDEGHTVRESYGKS